MDIEIKIINDKRYKDGAAFDAAIERFEDKGWRLAEICQDYPEHGDDAVAIFWKPVLKD